jgi:hypothetical protein
VARRVLLRRGMPTLAPIGSRTRKLILALSSFSAVSAIAGGIALIFSRPESPYSPPLRLLEHTPFADFVVPGLLLAIVVGGTSLICATLASRRSPRTIDAAIVAGGALTVWIVAEVAMFRSIHCCMSRAARSASRSSGSASPPRGARVRRGIAG